ncbi:nuclear envelope pore membrane protein POM 121C isoform X3 [Alligator mississippiensis]|uniref:nuclear envelope pore membrane protein POM 121C isoform X3 n=1 Tax=Alligator mississippiensis TaxID=8496 RepID=UPI0028780A5F|nr:nuclear envelope pore membrane protein POM 121C isoform X3 [Alligator mississippiensis]
MGSRLGQPGTRAGAALPSPTRRPSFGNHLTPPTRFVQTLRRRYPIQQAQYASLGALPTVCWDGFQKKSVLSARNSSMVQSPVTVKIAPPDSNLSHSPITLDPCAKETVLSALKESRKRAVEEEDDQTFPNEQENKRRRHDSSGSGQSAFEPLVANGAPASLVPKPGSLKRGLTSQCLDECLNKRSRSSSISSMNNMYTGGIPSSIRNAIASSYSSTRGLSQVWKRSGLSTSPLSSPASSRSQTPERPLKKAREEEPHRSSTSTPVKSDMELQAERAVETPVQKKQSSLNLPSLSESSGKRKRKIQLLSSRRGDQLALPPPPQLSFPVTVEDLDAEKKAVLKCFNKVLEDKTVDSTATSSAETIPASKPLSFTLMSAGPTSVLTAPLVSNTGSLLESLKKMQNSQSIPVLSDSTGVAATSQPVPAAPLLSASNVPLNSSSLSVTASDSKLVPMLNLPVPLAPPCSLVQPGSSESSLGVPTSLELGPTPSKPPSTPKPSILFGMLSTPPASQPAAATATSSTPTTTAPVFKPIFGSLSKSENMAPSAAGTSTTVMVSSSATSLSTTSPASTTVFKPVFGSLTTSGPSATASPFPFKQASQLASTADLNTASTTGPPVFASFPNSIFTTAATTSTVLSTITECTTKPMFSFGLNLPSSTSVSASPAVSTATSTSASQPFLFGAPSSSVPSTETGFASTGPVFGFGKPTVTTATTTTNVPAGSTFGQAPLNVAQATPSTITTTTTGFSIFGSAALTSSTPATTGQSTLSFGSSLTPFGSFGTGAKPPPAYSGAASQPAFGTGTSDSQQSANKPTAGPASFSAPFSFGASTTQSTAQPAFGSNTQPAFGANSQASFGTSSNQPAFGGTTSIFSFGTATTATTSSFGSNTQTTNSGARGMVFGSATPSPFAFGASTQQSTGPSAFGIGSPSLGGSTPAVAFNFGAGQSGSAGAITLFGSSLTQNTLGAQNQSTSFAFSAAGTPDNKPVFGGTPAPSFGQSTPVPGGAGGGSNSLSFGTPSTPASGFGSVGPSFAPSFSIGSGSKTGARQRLQARRQHTRKK